MAVFQGTRLRTTPLPAATPSIRPRRDTPRRDTPASSHTMPRVRPMGMLMAAILAATMLGLVYLTQTLGSHATSTQIVRLTEARDDLNGRISLYVSEAIRRTDSGLTAERAQDLGLRELSKLVVLRDAP